MPTEGGRFQAPKVSTKAAEGHRHPERDAQFRYIAALAVESVRRWWGLAGKAAYPQASRLLVTCDADGSDGYRSRAWKAGLAALAQETGLDITVCHFPPGTREHR